MRSTRSDDIARWLIHRHRSTGQATPLAEAPGDPCGSPAALQAANRPVAGRPDLCLFCQHLAGERCYYPRSIESTSIIPDGGGRPPMIVNLNQFRKKRERAEAERRAAQNRVRFGRDKAERSREAREIDRGKKAIDDKRLE